MTLALTTDVDVDVGKVVSDNFSEWMMI